MDSKAKKKIVVIGGGTGSFTLLSGLKKHDLDIVSLVNMADDGGSTGILRDELGALPPGDVRQCLVALSNSEKLRDLFNYRFSEGSFKGHAFGNLFLSALEKMEGDFASGVEVASELLRIKGQVHPITLSQVTLCLKTEKGTLKGEFQIGQYDFGSKRPEMWLEPEARLNPKAKEAIKTADAIVIAPGNLYGSLAPALLTNGLGEAVKKSKAKKVYVCNLVTKPGQTDDFMVWDFASEIERFLGAPFLDTVVYNTRRPSEKLFDQYAAEGEYLVEADEAVLRQKHYEAVGADILARKAWGGEDKSDPIASTRSYIRHDSDKIANVLKEICFK
jgi:uncharacterized cofD-like protein